jgi:hypothetical protein
MATVRFSEELKSDILRKARDMFDAEQQKARESAPVWGDDVYDLLFSETRSQMEAMPEGYFKTYETVGIDGVKWATEDEMPQKTIRLSVEVKFSKPMPWPFNPDRLTESMGAEPTSSYRNDIMLDGDDSRWASYVAEMQAYQGRVEAVETRKSEFGAGVNAIIQTFSTLAPALKEWPPLWDLLPYDKQARHKEIVERKKRVVSVNTGGDNEPVDLNKMTAAVTLSKLTR